MLYTVFKVSMRVFVLAQTGWLLSTQDFRFPNKNAGDADRILNLVFETPMLLALMVVPMLGFECMFLVGIFNETNESMVFVYFSNDVLSHTMRVVAPRYRKWTGIWSIFVALGLFVGWGVTTAGYGLIFPIDRGLDVVSVMTVLLLGFVVLYFRRD